MGVRGTQTDFDCDKYCCYQPSHRVRWTSQNLQVTPSVVSQSSPLRPLITLFF